MTTARGVNAQGKIILVCGSSTVAHKRPEVCVFRKRDSRGAWLLAQPNRAADLHVCVNARWQTQKGMRCHLTSQKYRPAQGMSGQDRLKLTPDLEIETCGAHILCISRTCSHPPPRRFRSRLPSPSPPWCLPMPSRKRCLLTGVRDATWCSRGRWKRQPCGLPVSPSGPRSRPPK